jgi:probable DNA repair protein
MGSRSAADIDAHLCAGGIVVSASERAARALVSAFHRARHAEQREAWSSPRIYSWHTFVRLAWDNRVADPRLILNATQELSLWKQLIGANRHEAALLEGPRRNLASLAMRGHALLCLYAPQYLEPKARSGWDQDCAAFSSWLSAFDGLCREHRAVSANRLPLELIPLLQSDAEPRQKLLLAGFDRVEPVQSAVFTAWGESEHIDSANAAPASRYLIAPDPAAEMAAAAAWCRQRLKTDPTNRILLITQDIKQSRGELERAFLRYAALDPEFRFEFSLGVPIAQTAAVCAAHLLLRWMEGGLAEHELDWLIASPSAVTQTESAALQARMRALRHRGLQRSNWKLDTFLSQRVPSAPLPEAWLNRMRAAQAELNNMFRGKRSPLDWADAVPHLLETLGWPGTNSLTSAEFQVLKRWQDVLDTCGSLGFSGSRMSWQDFLSELTDAASETLFAPESEDSPILITGPAESAGLTADAIWFLGATEEAWPARSDSHPLLPIDVQMRAGMPGSSAQLDWDLADAMTSRIAASAGEVIFSYARQKEGVEARSSGIASRVAGHAQPLPLEWLPASTESDLTSAVEDVGAVPLLQSESGQSPIHLRGGAGLLTSQSQCPFKAFATGRLAAKTWDPAEAGLTAAERGQILHAVLHSLWDGPPDGIRSSRELNQTADLATFVLPHVLRAITENAPSRVREEMPARYIELESERLTRLVSEWLRYEQTRLEFEVIGTEVDKTLSVGAVSLKLRLDRLDRLNDGSVLVVDYKTGNVSPKAWDLPRPEDIQLPLYARFGLDEGEVVGGLAFARVRPGDMCFAGRVGNATGTIDSSLKSTSSLVKYPLDLEQLIAWRDKIEGLARDFVAGRADVDPRDAPNTCERCGLQTLCRISEQTVLSGEPEAEAAYE